MRIRMSQPPFSHRVNARSVASHMFGLGAFGPISLTPKLDSLQRVEFPLAQTPNEAIERLKAMIVNLKAQLVAAHEYAQKAGAAHFQCTRAGQSNCDRFSVLLRSMNALIPVLESKISEMEKSIKIATAEQAKFSLEARKVAAAKEAALEVAREEAQARLDAEASEEGAARRSKTAKSAIKIGAWGLAAVAVKFLLF